MTTQVVGAGERIAAQLLTAALAIVLAGLVTWIVSYSLVLGWIGLGLLALSLPVGPALAVVATQRLLPAVSGPRILPVVLGTWIGAAFAVTVYAFEPSQWTWGHHGALAALVPGGLLGAIIGASVRRHDANSG